jgi:hypothetical protein
LHTESLQGSTGSAEQSWPQGQPPVLPELPELELELELEEADALLEEVEPVLLDALEALELELELLALELLALELEPVELAEEVPEVPESVPVEVAVLVSSGSESNQGSVRPPQPASRSTPSAAAERWTCFMGFISGSERLGGIEISRATWCHSDLWSQGVGRRTGSARRRRL